MANWRQKAKFDKLVFKQSGIGKESVPGQHGAIWGGPHWNVLLDGNIVAGGFTKLEAAFDAGLYVMENIKD